MSTNVFGDHGGNDDEESVDDIALPASNPNAPALAPKRTSSKSPVSKSKPGVADGVNDEMPPPMPLDEDRSRGSQNRRLRFSLNGHAVEQSTTIFRAVQEFGRAGQGGEEGDVATFTPATKSMWSDVYTLTYEYSREEAKPSGGAAMASSAGAKSAVSSPSIYVKGQNKYSGAVAAEAGSSVICVADRALLSTLDIGVGRLGQMESRRAVEEIEATLVLLRIAGSLITASRRLQIGIAPEVASRASAEGCAVDTDELFDPTLANKVLRQLQDPLTLCSGTIPEWMGALMTSSPFLFPFECKRQFFVSTQLGVSRALARLQRSETTAGGGTAVGSAASQDNRSSSALRIQRQKVRISRSRIIDSASKVMELYASHKAVLEVEFFGEAGTGLGPTLEFYTLVSRELQKAKLALWRSSEAIKPPSEGAEGADADVYITSKTGLFPRPLTTAPAAATTDYQGAASSAVSSGCSSRSVPRSSARSTSHTVSSVGSLSRFKMLGRLMAKALQDSRLLDIHFNPLLFKLLCAHDPAHMPTMLGLADIEELDSHLFTSLSKMDALAAQYAAIEADVAISADDKAAAIGALRYDGVMVDDLSLDFTCPGYPDVALTPNGAERSVCLGNLGEYVQLVVDATVGSGVTSQVLQLREGFHEIIAVEAMQYFSATELDIFLCGDAAPWTVEELAEHCATDHGYTHSSMAVQFLFQALADFDAKARRDFLCFATGSPQLPVGGLAALTPKLVRL